MIQTEKDVTARTVRALRDKTGLSQSKFWQAIGVSLARGNRYETGKNDVIPADVQRLVFLHYVIGIPTGGTPEELRAMVSAAEPVRKARKNAESAIKGIDKAAKALHQARGDLTWSA